MNVFISWSGETSREVASVLHTYLPSMLQRLDVFMSAHDVESGTRWSLRLSEELSKSTFGIICLTPDNIESPWLLFEAGALSRDLDERACGILLDGLKPTNVTGPLSQFQHRQFNENDMRALLGDLNSLEPGLDSGTLDRVFSQWWEDLRQTVNDAIARTSVGARTCARPSDREILEEVHATSRNIERIIQGNSLRSSLDVIYNRLSDSERRLLGRLVTANGARTIVNEKILLDEHSAEDLRHLRKLGLVLDRPHGITLRHDVIAQYIHELQLY